MTKFVPTYFWRFFNVSNRSSYPQNRDTYRIVTHRIAPALIYIYIYIQLHTVGHLFSTILKM